MILENVTLGQYFPGDSPLHRMDPRAKILCAVALIVAIFAASSFWGYGAMFLFIALCVALSRINVKFVVKGLKPVWVIILLTFVMNLFLSTGGDVIFRWRFISVTRMGLVRAVQMAFRLALLICSTQILTLTTSPIALTDGLERLMRPLQKIGFPAHELAMMMSIALRFIPTLIEETQKIIKAQMARGADFESGNIVRRAKAMLPILVPLFVSAFRRADELAMAMEARCYRGGKGRTRMKITKFGTIDLCAALLTAGILALEIWL